VRRLGRPRFVVGPRGDPDEAGGRDVAAAVASADSLPATVAVRETARMIRAVASAALLVLPLAGCAAGGGAVASSPGTVAARPGDETLGRVESVAAATCAVPRSVTAGQVVLVKATGTTARVSACTRTSSGTYHRSLGSYAGHVGTKGLAPAGAKREGDGRTPSGTFALRRGFGTAADPGTALTWRRVGARDVWVDDPTSPLYNSQQRLPADGRWRSAEKLNVRAYEYAQVIGYNEKRKPGLGSAIFLHIDSGRPTAGCVSVSRAALLKLLRWQKPGAVIVITN
jgi:L,D-peptidoglycan transpeptidase YkuD (ErfK/YbiS/YcfS/YnhG family)